MNEELSKKTVFEDALTQLDGDKIVDPFYLQQIGEIDEIGEYLQNKPGVFFLEGDLILNVSKTFYVCNEKLSRDLERFGYNIIVKDRKDFSLFLFYTLFMSLDEENEKDPFDKNKIKFANKLFYYLESPIDPFILKSWGIKLDLTAVNFECVVDF